MHIKRLTLCLVHIKQSDFARIVIPNHHDKMLLYGYFRKFEKRVYLTCEGKTESFLTDISKNDDMPNTYQVP